MSECLQAVVAAALAVQASAPIVLYRPFTLKVPHAVSVLLLQHKHAYMSPARHLSYILFCSHSIMSLLSDAQQ